jgi:hypothetical protein
MARLTGIQDSTGAFTIKVIGEKWRRDRKLFGEVKAKI